MTYFLGMLIGALISTGLIAYLLYRFLIKRWNAGVLGMALACAITAVITVVLAGYGNADGGDPKFAEGVIVYVPAAIIVFGLMAFGLRKKS